VEKGRHWKNINDKVRDDIEDCLSNEGRTFGDTVSIVRGEIPVTGNRTEIVSISATKRIH
jgi:hypothetical protein